MSGKFPSIRWAVTMWWAGAVLAADDAAEPGAWPGVAERAPMYQLAAFGGELQAWDLGEWGGAVALRPAIGPPLPLILENGRGLFATDFGVVALTGLAHMTIDRGAVYLLAQDAAGTVSATRTLELPGVPCAAVQRNGTVHLKVSLGWTTEGTRQPERYRCLALTAADIVVEEACADLSVGQCPP